MKVISYSRLGNVAGYDLAETSWSGPFFGQTWGSESHDRGYNSDGVLFMPPYGVDPKVTIIHAPFHESVAYDGESVESRRTNLLHYKLPESCVGNSATQLTRKARKAGLPDNWEITFSTIHLRPPGKYDDYYDDSGWTWQYSENSPKDGSYVEYETMSYHAFWTNQLWWVEENPRLTEDAVLRQIRFYPSTHRLEMRETPWVSVSYGPVPRAAVEDSLVRTECWNRLHQQVRDHQISFGPWEYHGTINYFIDANRDELPPISDLFGERARLHENSTLHQFEYDWLVQHAFMDACSDIGKMNDNMISNIKEIAEFLIGLCSGKTIAKYLGKEISVGLDDAPRILRKKGGGWWLKSRYAVGTTIMDLQDFSKFLCKRTDQYFNFLNKNYFQHSYGVAKRMVDGVAVECRCKIEWRPRSLTGLKSVFKYLHDTGLEFNPYVLWDMIPYSFVVDWFAPVGDFFAVKSDAKYYTEEYYDFASISFSLKYSMQGVNDSVGTRYTRWYQGPPVIDGYTWFDKGGSTVSTKTKVKRLIDGGALMEGLCETLERR